jgi:hypothetical protein
LYQLILHSKAQNERGWLKNVKNAEKPPAKNAKKLRRRLRRVVALKQLHLHSNNRNRPTHNSNRNRPTHNSNLLPTVRIA